MLPQEQENKYLLSESVQQKLKIYLASKFLLTHRNSLKNNLSL